jgi:hypothetical protein
VATTSCKIYMQQDALKFLCVSVYLQRRGAYFTRRFVRDTGPYF